MSQVSQQAMEEMVAMLQYLYWIRFRLAAVLVASDYSLFVTVHFRAVVSLAASFLQNVVLLGKPMEEAA